MRVHLRPWCFFTVLAAVASGCEDAQAASPGDASHVDAGSVADGGEAEAGHADEVWDGRELTRTFDFRQGGEGTNLANSTITFALGEGPRTQVQSAAMPGEIFFAYTRTTGCPSDPPSSLDNGQLGEIPGEPINPESAAPMRLRLVSIEQICGPGCTATPLELAQQTCLLYRDASGKWHLAAGTPDIVVKGNAAVARFDLDMEANAVAIFVAIQTTLGRLGYGATAE